MLNATQLDLKGFLGRSVSSKNNAREVNPRLKTYVYAYMFRRNADNVWHETGQLCKGWRQSKKKWADLSAFPKIDMGLWQNADFDSKPCVLQHFGSPPFNSITSKYCKGYKFHKKEDFKMLKNRGVVPGPVTVVFHHPLKGNLLDSWSTGEAGDLSPWEFLGGGFEFTTHQKSMRCERQIGSTSPTN